MIVHPQTGLTLKHEPDERVLARFGDGSKKDHDEEVLKLEEAFKTVELDPLSKLLFHLSNSNVAFVGAYDTKNNKIYLYPLVPWTDAGYTTENFELNRTNKEIVGELLSSYAQK